MSIKPPDVEHIRRLNEAKQAAIYLVALHQNMKLLWCLACLEDGLDINDQHVVFKTGNSYLARLNRTIAALWKARGQYEKDGLGAITIEPMEEAGI